MRKQFSHGIIFCSLHFPPEHWPCSHIQMQDAVKSRYKFWLPLLFSTAMMYIFFVSHIRNIFVQPFTCSCAGQDINHWIGWQRGTSGPGWICDSTLPFLHREPQHVSHIHSYPIFALSRLSLCVNAPVLIFFLLS